MSSKKKGKEIQEVREDGDSSIDVYKSGNSEVVHLLQFTLQSPILCATIANSVYQVPAVTLLQDRVDHCVIILAKLPSEDSTVIVCVITDT